MGLRSGSACVFELCGESPVGSLTGIPIWGPLRHQEQYPIRHVISTPKPEMMSVILELIIRQKITSLIASPLN